MQTCVKTCERFPASPETNDRIDLSEPIDLVRVEVASSCDRGVSEADVDMRLGDGGDSNTAVRSGVLLADTSTAACDSPHRDMPHPLLALLAAVRRIEAVKRTIRLSVDDDMNTVGK
jgi:hypothetical protein|eukprot:5750831-Prymnesium_polylepis.1